MGPQKISAALDEQIVSVGPVQKGMKTKDLTSHDIASMQSQLSRNLASFLFPLESGPPVVPTLKIPSEGVIKPGMKRLWWRWTVISKNRDRPSALYRRVVMVVWSTQYVSVQFYAISGSLINYVLEFLKPVSMFLMHWDASAKGCQAKGCQGYLGASGDVQSPSNQDFLW